MTDKEFDELIRKSVTQYGSDYEIYSSDKHKFSDRFENQMSELIRSKKEEKHKFLRLVLSLSALAAVLVIGIIGVNILMPMMNLSSGSSTVQDLKSPVADENDVSDSTNTTDSVKTADTQNNEAEEQPAAEDAKMDNIVGDIDNNVDSIDNNAGTDYSFPINNSSKSIKSVGFEVTAKISGKETTLDDEKAERIAIILLGVLSDNSILSDSELTEEKLEYFSEKGDCVTIQGKNSSPLEISRKDGTKYTADSVTIMFDHSECYLIVVSGNETNVFSVSEMKEFCDGLHSYIQ